MPYFCGLSDENKRKFMTCDWLIQPYYVYFYYARAINCDPVEDVIEAVEQRNSENIFTHKVCYGQLYESKVYTS